MPDPVYSNNRKLYDNLLSTKKISTDEVGDFDTFNANMGDSELAKKFYNNLKTKKGFTDDDLGDENTFLQHLDPVAVRPPDQAIEPAAATEQAQTKPTATESFNSSLPYVHVGTPGGEPVVVPAVNSKENISFDPAKAPIIGAENKLDEVIPQAQAPEDRYFEQAQKDMGGAKISSNPIPKVQQLRADYFRKQGQEEKARKVESETSTSPAQYFSNVGKAFASSGQTALTEIGIAVEEQSLWANDLMRKLSDNPGWQSYITRSEGRIEGNLEALRASKKEIPSMEGKPGAFIGGMLPFAGMAVASVLAKSPALAGATSGMFAEMGFGAGVEAYDEYKKESKEPVSAAERTGAGILYGAAMTLPMTKYISELGGGALKTLVPKAIVKTLEANPEATTALGREIFENFAKKQPTLAKKLATALAKGAGHGVATMEAMELSKKAVDEFLIGRNVSAEEWWKTIVDSAKSGVVFGTMTAPFGLYAQSSTNKQRREQQGTVTLSRDEKGNPFEIIVDRDGQNKGLTPDGKIVDITPDQIKNSFTIPTKEFNEAMDAYKATGEVAPDIERKAYSGRLLKFLDGVAVRKSGAVMVTKDEQGGTIVITGRDSKGNLTGMDLEGNPRVAPADSPVGAIHKGDIYDTLMTRFDKSFNEKQQAQQKAGERAQYDDARTGTELVLRNNFENLKQPDGNLHTGVDKNGQEVIIVSQTPGGMAMLMDGRMVALEDIANVQTHPFEAIFAEHMSVFEAQNNPDLQPSVAQAQTTFKWNGRNMLVTDVSDKNAMLVQEVDAEGEPVGRPETMAEEQYLEIVKQQAAAPGATPELLNYEVGGKDLQFTPDPRGQYFSPQLEGVNTYEEAQALADELGTRIGNENVVTVVEVPAAGTTPASYSLKMRPRNEADGPYTPPVEEKDVTDQLYKETEVQPTYTLNGQPIERGKALARAKAAIFDGNKAKIEGLEITGDKEITDMIDKAFPKPVAKFTIGKKKASSEDAMNWIDAADTLEELKKLKIENIDSAPDVRDAFVTRIKDFAPETSLEEMDNLIEGLFPEPPASEQPAADTGDQPGVSTEVNNEPDITEQLFEQPKAKQDDKGNRGGLPSGEPKGESTEPVRSESTGSGEPATTGGDIQSAKQVKQGEGKPAGTRAGTESKGTRQQRPGSGKGLVNEKPNLEKDDNQDQNGVPAFSRKNASDKAPSTTSGEAGSTNTGPANTSTGKESIKSLTDDALNDAVYKAARLQNIELSDTETLALSAFVKLNLLPDNSASLEEGISSALDVFGEGKRTGKITTKEPIERKPAGHKVSTPNASYNEGVESNSKQTGDNIWVRNSTDKENADRTLMVQFSSGLMYGEPSFHRSLNEAYFDKLYRHVKGYDRTVDFWEVPAWMGRVAAIEPKSDVYIVRDLAEASKFIKEAGYGKVLFSAMDVVKNSILDIVKANTQQKFQIGQYTPFKEVEALPNVQTFKSVEEFSEKNNLPVSFSYDYSNFEGTAVIPRLRTSEGCKFKCAFCSNVLPVKPLSKQVVMDQVESLKFLDATLVYVGDKAFGQAPNAEVLIDAYDRIKEYNPDFEGFIIQTSAADFANKKVFSKEYLGKAHIKYVELGVETYNDDILTKLNKKHSHKKHVDAALDNARENDIKVVPNLIVGLTGKNEDGSMWSETKETYSNTLAFLNANKDVISHANIYALAIYENTEIADAVDVKAEADSNENIVEKSFHSDPAVHRWAMDAFSNFAFNQLDKHAGIRTMSPEALAKTYKKRLSRLKADNPKTYWSVDLPSDEVILDAAKSGRLVDLNGGMGIVTEDGNLVGLFKYDKSSKGTAKAVQNERIKRGGIKLDAYDTEGTGEVSLIPTYKKNGFREVSRVDFNPEFAPEDMPAEVKSMNPDVVTMVYDPENKMNIKFRRFNKEQYEEALEYRDSYVTPEPIPDHNKSADTQGFFSDVVTGKSDKYKPRRKWQPLMKFSPAEEAVRNVYDKFNGNFDEHIATSIPGFRDIQIKVVSALNEMYGKDGGLIYDIGGSEGGFVKALTELSDGRFKSINLDANGDMEAVHNATPVEGSTFVKEAFGEGFEYDGVTYERHVPTQKADVVHESMTFQFIDEKRADKLDELTQNYLKEDGLFITEEKVHPKDQAQWKANEAKKDAEFKTLYYDPEQIDAKREEVLTGMVANQTTYSRYKNELLKKFDYVEEYWDSGNFKGLVASNDKAKVDQFLAEVGDTHTKFSELNATGEEHRPLFQAGKIYKGIKETPKFNNLKDLSGWLAKWSAKNKIFASEEAKASDDTFVKALVKHTMEELKALEDIEGYEYIGFYDFDIPARLNPELQRFAEKRYGFELTPAQISLYHLLSGFASPQADPVMDSSKGLFVFDRYMQTGELSAKGDKPATVWALDDKGNKVDTGVPKLDEEGNPVMAKVTISYAESSLLKFKDVLTYFNEDLNKTIDWISSRHSYEEISKVLGVPVKGKKALETHEYLSKEEGGFGIFGFTGVKLGSYILNRMGNFSTVTKDMWYARTMARLTGEELQDAKGDVIKLPWELTVEGKRKRALADKAWGIVAKKLGTTPADIQQRMWEFEKRLYEQLGVNKQSGTTGYASEGLLKQAAIFEPDLYKNQVIAEAVADVNTNPTEAQKAAGNYKKGHVDIQGMGLSIENPKGSIRKGKDEDGKAWKTEMKSHYGYFKNSLGKDGDHIDAFIGENPDSQTIYVVDQISPNTGDFDESKVMLGYNSEAEAKAAYLENYAPSWKGLKDITPVGVEDFKKWLYDGARQNKPFSEYSEVGRPAFARKPSSLGFYSPTEAALDNIQQNKGSVEQFKAMLIRNGAKQAEMDWMGFDETFPDGKKPITKADIQSWIDQNKIEIQEVQKGASNWDGNELMVNGEVVANVFENDDETWSYQSDSSEGEETFATRTRAMEEAEMAEMGTYSENATKYEKYVEPGGENYKELLLTMPEANAKLISGTIKAAKNDALDDILTDIDSEGLGDLDYGRTDNGTIEFEGFTPSQFEQLKEITRSNNAEFAIINKTGLQNIFSSSHWNEPNIVVHVRFDERSSPKPNPNYRDKTNHVPDFDKDYELIDKGDHYVVKVKGKGGESPFMPTYSKAIMANNNMDEQGLKDYLMKNSELGKQHSDFKNNPKTLKDKVLFIEEFQSDWAQKGKKEGFTPKKPDFSKEEQAIAAAQDLYDHAVSKRDAAIKRMQELGLSTNPSSSELRDFAYDGPRRNSEYIRIEDAKMRIRNNRDWDAAEARQKEIEQEYIDADKARSQAIAEIHNMNDILISAKRDLKRAQDTAERGIPAMPFNKTDQWVNLAFRRMIRYAAENGFERIAWTNGDMQAARYDLSTQVDELVYDRDEAGGTLIGYKDGMLVVDEKNVPESKLPDFIGKDAAEKMISKYNENGRASIEGEDLKVGGTGMKAFYDNIVPAAAGKLGKPFGAKVETINMKNTDINTFQEHSYLTVQSLQITDAMRESVLGGVPLFAKGRSAQSQDIEVSKEVINDLESAAKYQTPVHIMNNEQAGDYLEGKVKTEWVQDVRDVEWFGVTIAKNIFLHEGNDPAKNHEVWVHEKAHTVIRRRYKTYAEQKEFLEDFYHQVGPAEMRRVLPTEYWFADKATKADEYIAYMAQYYASDRERFGDAPDQVKNLIFGIINEFIDPKNLDDATRSIDMARQRVADRNASASQSQRPGLSEAPTDRNGGQAPNRTGLRQAVGLEGRPAFELLSDLAPTKGTITVDGVDRPVQNSKGQLIHPTKSGLENFWKWFGDSKVVDAQGRPLVVYHGTAKDFEAFSKKGINFNQATLGYYFTSAPEPNTSKGHYYGSTASEYAQNAQPEGYSTPGGANIVPAYLAINSPIELNADGWYSANTAVDKQRSELENAKSTGKYDGIISSYKKDKDGGNEQILVAFNPSQIKSATGNNGDFDPSDDRIAFSRKPQLVVNKKQVVTTGEYLEELIVNNKLALENWMADVATVVPKIEDYENPLLKDALAKSKVTTRLRNFETGVYKKLVSASADILKTAGITQQELSHYTIAVHGKERNEKFWNAQPDRAGEDFAGLTELKAAVRAASKSPMEQLRIDGMNNEDFADYYKDLIEAKLTPAKVKAFWDSIHDISKMVRDEMLDSGMISKEYYDELGKMYQDYVPLRAWEEHNPEEFEFSRGVGEYNAPIIQAKGRKSLADDPISTLLQTANTAYITGERNRVKRAAGELVRNNKDALKDVVQYKRVYFVDSGALDPQGNPIITETIDRPDQALFDAGQVTTKMPKEYTKRRTSAQSKEFEVEFYDRGKKFVLVFEGSDPAVARAINNREASVGIDYLNTIVGTDIKIGNTTIPSIKAMSRYLSSINTTYSVDFPLVNFLRDAPMAILSEYVYGDAKTAFKMFPYMKRAESAMRRKLKKQQNPGDPDDQAMEDFFNFGGPTGFAFLRDVDEFKSALKNDIRRINRIKNPFVRMEVGFRRGLELVGQLGEWSETITRFATYINRIEQGETKEQAALAAKKATVMFDQHGRLSGTLNGLYTFFNAAVQAVDKYLQLWGKNWKKMAAIHMFLTVQGFLNAMLLDLFGGEDKEGVRNYDKVTDFTKKNNIIIPMYSLDENVTFPIPQILRKFHGIGWDSYDLMSGRKEPGAVLLSQLSSLPSDISPIDTGGFLNKDGDLSLKPLVPSIMRPIVELEANENFMKLPISPEPFSLEMANKIADTRRAYKDVNKIAQWTTDKLYELGGGDATGFKYVYKDGKLYDVPALLDISPESIEHLFESYFGGVGKLVNRTWKTTSNIYGAGVKMHEGKDFDEAIKEIDVNVVPVVNRFIRTPMGDPLMKQFRKVRNDFENKIKVLKQAEKDGDWAKFERMYIEIGPQLENYKAIMTSFENVDSQRARLLKTMPGAATSLDKEGRKLMQEIISIK
jgi:hypothetical protein